MATKKKVHTSMHGKHARTSKRQWECSIKKKIHCQVAWKCGMQRLKRFFFFCGKSFNKLNNKPIKNTVFAWHGMMRICYIACQQIWQSIFNITNGVWDANECEKICRTGFCCCCLFVSSVGSVSWKYQT